MRERAGVIAQLSRFLWTQRLWWLLPIVIGLMAIAALIVGVFWSRNRPPNGSLLAARDPLTTWEAG